MTPEDIIDTLGLDLTPKVGGFEKRSAAPERSASTAIYYLLKRRNSPLASVADADDLTGMPGVLLLPSETGMAGKDRTHNIVAGERPQAVVPRVLQSARPRRLGACRLCCRTGFSV